MSKIVLFILLFAVASFGQRRMERPPLNSEFILSDIIYLPEDSTTSAYLTYRIPYNRLVFVKNGEGFEASYRFSFEVFDSNSKFTERHTKENTVRTKDFDSTDSPTAFEQGFIRFNVNEGEYSLVASFTDLKSNREFKLKRGNLRLNKKAKFMQPLVVSRDEKCSASDLNLVNYEGNIPFDGNSYELLIPVRDQNVYYAEILSNGYVIKELTGLNKISEYLTPVLCEGSIFLQRRNSTPEVSFLVVNPGNKILEGELLIKIYDEQKEHLSSIPVNVRWYNKPRTLMNRQLALRLLKNIDEEESYKYVEEDKEKFDSLFFDYWKKYDPSPNTSYNELMNEFYSRADYAAMNFGTISGRTGLESDRGKIYLKYGKPLKIDRKSTDKGKIVEVWFYANERVFTFIDERGTGDFNLLRG
jgi:GWxTD domain-containing protein